MKHEFKRGDVVFLKSGSPALTVEEVGPVELGSGIPCGSLGVVWFDGGESQRDVFPAVCLLPEEAVCCDDPSCVHCFPVSNCTRDECPHCDEENEDRELNKYRPGDN